MKHLLLAATLFLSACVSTYPRPQIPWPGQYESQFLYWCKDVPDDEFWRVDIEWPEECPAGEVSRGQWDPARLPLIVNSDVSLEAEVELAVIHWNQALGFDVFKWDRHHTNPDVAVVEAGLLPFMGELVPWAHAKRVTMDGVDYGAVFTYNGLHIYDAKNTMIHELGHILGLRHDADKMSLMYQGAEDPHAVIAPNDIAALRWLYKDAQK